MATKDYEDKLTKRLLIIAAVYAAMLVAVQLPNIIISVRFARLSTDFLYEGSLDKLKWAIMALSPLSNYIRCGFLLWVTFYYGKKNSVTVLIITVGSIILSAGMEASPDRTSDLYFNYDWNIHLIEYGIRFLCALGVTFILWFAAASLGKKYRRHHHHGKKLPLFPTYCYAAIAFLTVDLIFQFYFYLSSAGKGPDSPTALDWIYPFIKAGAGLGVACLIGTVLTGIRRSVRKKDSTRQKKEIAKEQA